MVIFGVLAFVALVLAGDRVSEGKGNLLGNFQGSDIQDANSQKVAGWNSENHPGFGLLELQDNSGNSTDDGTAVNSDSNNETSALDGNGQENSTDNQNQIDNSSGTTGNSETNTSSGNSGEESANVDNTTQDQSANDNNQNSSNSSSSNDTGNSSSTPTDQNQSNNTNSDNSNPSDPLDSNSTDDEDSNSTEPSTPDDQEDQKNETTSDPDELICPKVSCSSSEDEDCLEEEDGNYVLHPCNSTHSCSFSYSNLSTSSCVATPPPEPFIKKTRGNSTGFCNKTSDCKEGWSCNDGKCKHLRTEDSYCKLIDECEKGTVCNKGKCVEYFSVSEGSSADYSVACASGILLHGTCQPPQLTEGELPKKCKKNSDCTASDGETQGTCACALDEKGSKYCKLHRSDPIALKHLEYSHEEAWYQSQYYTLVYNAYPVNLFVDECFVKNNKEMKELSQAEEYAKLETAYFLALSGIMMMIF